MMRNAFVAIFLSILSFLGFNKTTPSLQSNTITGVSIITPPSTVTKKATRLTITKSNKVSPTSTPSSLTDNNNQSTSNNSENISSQPTNAPTSTPKPTSTIQAPPSTPYLSPSTFVPTSTLKPALPTSTPISPPTNTPAPVSSTVYVTVYYHPDHEDKLVPNAPVKLINKITGEQLGFGFTSQNGESPRWQVAPNTEFKVTVYKPRDWVTNYCGSEWSRNTGPYGTWQVENMRINPPNTDPCISE